MSMVVFENNTPIEAHILDFKTDALINSLIQFSIDTYRPQMAAYRSALSALLKLNPAAIKATLIFVSTGQLVSV